MKKFVIVQASVDQPTADDDGAMNAIGFGLSDGKLYDTKEDANMARMRIMGEDLTDMAENCLTNEDGYEGEIESGVNGEMEVNFYYNGDIVNSTRYRIEEVNF